MSITKKLNSNKDFEETIHYTNNKLNNQGNVMDNDYATCRANSEVKVANGSPLMVREKCEGGSVKQDNKINLYDNMHFNSQIKAIRLEDDQALEEFLYRFRSDLSCRLITRLPEEQDVVAPFPLETFPDWANHLVSDIAHTLQVSKDAVAPALLGATFIAARGNYVIKVKNDYQEPLTAYIIVIIPSGGRKSAIVNYFRKPLNEFEADLQIAFDANSTSRKSDREAWDAIRKRLKQKAIEELNVESLDDINDSAKRLGEKLALIERETQKMKTRPQLLIGSATGKALPRVMALQNEAIGVFEAEGGIWKNRIRPSEDDIFLKGYTMEPFGDETTTDSVTMQGPCLAICTYSQKTTTDKIYSNDELKCDGLLHRILTVFVSKNHWYRDPNPRDVSDEILKKYSDKIRSLLSIKRPKGKENERTFLVLELTDNARKLRQEYATLNASRISAGIFKDFEAFGEKLAGHAVRLAGALHLLNHEVPHEHKIDYLTMNGGIALAEYFAQHAISAFDTSRLQSITYAKKILKWIDHHKKAKFTEREADRGVGHCKIADIRAGLDMLEKNGFIGRFLTKSGTCCIVNPRYLFNSIML